MFDPCYSSKSIRFGPLPNRALRFCATVAGRAETFPKTATMEYQYSPEQLARRYAYTKKWRKNNRKHCIDYSRAYDKKNRERNKIRSHEYFRQHGKEIYQKRRLYGIAWRKNNPEWMRKYNKHYRKKNSVRLSAMSMVWQRAHPEIVKARIKNWQLRHPEKLRAASQRRRAFVKTNSSAREIAAASRKMRKLFSQKEAVCPYCSKTFATREMHLDHIFPICKGGRHAPKNICLACSDCNSKKSYKILFVEWTPPNALRSRN